MGIHSLSILNDLIQVKSEELKTGFIDSLGFYDLVNSYSSSIYILCAVIFCFWMYRANKNTRMLGIVNLKFSPSLAVGSFFIPILSLYWPYKAIKEIWKGSFSETVSWQDGSSSPLIILWWLCFLVSIIGTQLAKLMKPASPSPSEFFNFLCGIISMQLISAISMILITIIVVSINKQQNKKYKRL